MVPWSAQALQEGCARDQPLVLGASHAHMTLEWVFRRLVQCQIRRHGENKGTWRWDSERGGAPRRGAPPRRAPQPGAGGHQRGVAELAQVVRRPPRCAIWDRTLPRGPPALGHAGVVPPVAVGEGGPLCGPVDCCASPATPRVRTRRPAPVRGVGGRHAEHRHRVRQGGRPYRSPPPPLRPLTSWRIPWRPRRPPHTSGQPWWLSRHKEHRRVLRYACVFVS